VQGADLERELVTLDADTRGPVLPRWERGGVGGGGMLASEGVGKGGREGSNLMTH
jgi:hypothetical protein